MRVVRKLLASFSLFVFLTFFLPSFFLQFAFLSHCWAELRCNGSTQLCSKRYNEISYATTHNGHAFIKNHLLELFPGSNISNQDRNIPLQFEDGIHATKIPLHSYEDRLYACHGLSEGLRKVLEVKICHKLGFLGNLCNNLLNTVNPCQLDPATQRMTRIFHITRRFLEKHPNEIITLFIEDDAGDFYHLEQLFRITGLYSYAHSQNPNEPWPTLEQMITTGKRLVVFNDRLYDKKGHFLGQFPIFNHTSTYVWQSRYAFANIEELRQDNPAETVHYEPAFLNRNEPPLNKLWVLQHFVTPTFGGSEEAAKIVNEAGILKTRLNKYARMAGSHPNFIWVDFYELPSSTQGIFSVINELNQTEVRN